MNFSFTIKADNTTSFINHWSERYEYSSEPKYTRNIGKPLTETSRRELFEWKNGSAISSAKLRSIEINYPLTFTGDIHTRYLSSKNGGGAIWNIFYAHCLAPEKYPMFDQHVFRAMRYLKNSKIEEIPSNDNSKISIYLEEYIDFHTALGKWEERKADKALFTFGRFLKIAKEFV